MLIAPLFEKEQYGNISLFIDRYIQFNFGVSPEKIDEPEPCVTT